MGLGFPGKTDTLELGTMSPRKGGPSAGTNSALFSGVQEGSRPVLPLLGQVHAKLAEEPGVATALLRGWVEQHEIYEGKREGLTTEEREELRRLRWENKVLKQDRDFLKTAVVFDGPPAARSLKMRQVLGSGRPWR
jgi:transposase